MKHNQKSFWNNFHSHKYIDQYSQTATEFAQKVLPSFPENANVLDLGCGLGNDSVFFARNNHSVIATDLSDLVIDNNKEKFSDIPNLKFQVLDTSHPFPFKDQQFDIVYARLSLHYFTDELTKHIFKEISRVLKPNGLLCFMCKTTKDSLYGKGKRLEKDMYNRDGHIRHFFSKQYAEECLTGEFKVESINEGFEDLYGKKSAFIEVLSRKND